MTESHSDRLLIRPANAGDVGEWRRMRALLWPDCLESTHREEMRDYLRADVAVAFVAARATGDLGGFVEATVRPFADGCDTKPVGYVEGWYVDADLRRQGIGRRLIRTAERWARGRGCTEMGSDCLLDNEGSLRAHVALGYEERERLIHFRRCLTESPRRLSSKPARGRGQRGGSRKVRTSGAGALQAAGSKSGGRHRA